MELRMPRFEPPWARKTAFGRTRDEVRKVQESIQKQVDKMELPKVELPTIRRRDVDQVVERTLKTAEETRKTLADGLDKAAAELGQDASREAAKLSKEAAKLSRKASKRGAELSRELAATGDQNLRALAKDVRALGDEVKELRITRKKRGPNMLPGIALLAGLASGLAAMFFFDPEQGRRRRALLRDQLVKWSRVTRETAEGQTKDLRNRVMGAAHEIRRSVEGGNNGSAAGQQPEPGQPESGELTGSTPYATADLAATDQAAGTESTGMAGAGLETAGVETVSVPEGHEGQPDLGPVSTETPEERGL